MKDLFHLIEKLLGNSVLKVSLVLAMLYFALSNALQLLLKFRETSATKVKLEKAKAELELLKVQQQIKLLKLEMGEEAQQVAPVAATVEEVVEEVELDPNRLTNVVVSSIAVGMGLFFLVLGVLFFLHIELPESWEMLLPIGSIFFMAYLIFNGFRSEFAAFTPRNRIIGVVLSIVSGIAWFFFWLYAN